MRVSVDVYTKSLNSAFGAIQKAADHGGTDIQLYTTHNEKTGKLNPINVTFRCDHLSPAITHLDNGEFAVDISELKR